MINFICYFQYLRTCHFRIASCGVFRLLPLDLLRCDLMDHSTNSTPLDYRPFGDQETSKDHDSGLAESDQWRLTPSMLDTNSFAFIAFANQHPSDFSSTPGAMSTVFHNQAGDLHTPGMGFGLGTPLSISSPEEQNTSASAMDMHGFHSHLLHSHPFQASSNAFAQQQSYAPSSFVHQDSGYEAMDASHDEMHEHKVGLDAAHQGQQSYEEFSTRSFANMQVIPSQSTEK